VKTVVAILVVLVVSVTTVTPTYAQMDPRGRELRPFMEWVAGQLNQWWGGEFAKRQYRFERPQAYLLPRSGLNYVCGGVDEVYDPFYVLSPCYSIFFTAPFMAPFWVQGLDGSVAAIMAHEWSHYITEILGQNTKNVFEEARADCHAGMFFRWASTQGILEPGDVEEGLFVMSISGSAGHSTGPDRMGYFRHGFQARGFGDCGREL
jgi:predicted metalloprotease